MLFCSRTWIFCTSYKQTENCTKLFIIWLQHLLMTYSRQTEETMRVGITQIGLIYNYLWNFEFQIQLQFFSKICWVVLLSSVSKETFSNSELPSTAAEHKHSLCTNKVKKLIWLTKEINDHNNKIRTKTRSFSQQNQCLITTFQIKETIIHQSQSDLNLISQTNNKPKIESHLSYLSFTLSMRTARWPMSKTLNTAHIYGIPT